MDSFHSVREGHICALKVFRGDLHVQRSIFLLFVSFGCCLWILRRLGSGRFPRCPLRSASQSLEMTPPSDIRLRSILVREPVLPSRCVGRFSLRIDSSKSSSTAGRSAARPVSRASPHRALLELKSHSTTEGRGSWEKRARSWLIVGIFEGGMYMETIVYCCPMFTWTVTA